MGRQINLRVNILDLKKKLGLDGIPERVVVERIIEKNEVVKEVPIITNEIKEVAVYETPEQTRDKLSLLAGEERLGIDDIHRLKEELDSIKSTTRGAGLTHGALKYFLKENIVPTGTINGVNLTFTLPDRPVADSLRVYADGVRQKVTADYTLSGTIITFVVAPTTTILCDYRV